MSPVKRLLLVALLIGFVLIPDVNAGGKQKVIKKVKKLLTKFATDAQLGKICDALAVDIYNMADTHTLANDAINIVMKSLTGSQMTQGIQIYNQIVNDFGGMENAMNVLNQVIGIFTDNLGGILTSVQSKIQEMKDSGTSQDDCIKKGYNLVDKAVSGSECLAEPLSVIIKATSMNVDQQKQAVEIANMALDSCGMENEIATFVKKKFDEITGKTWHVIVGRNFGSHVSWEQYIHFTVSKITILVFQCG
ncbi:dynein light chain type 1 domain-containing protein [Ditylenchus destructor]|uniref:Dynein light chain 1, cytoplasmic n=1 Tax=Ditylenchus destructor TaxID=166010 RepID=A0AAD4N4W5_9BILA|nr:dynein light chain type 1 domain-containing protein [Ditylenchus destructor]